MNLARGGIVLLVAVVGALLVAAPNAESQDAPMCNGRTATIWGTRGDDVLRGTPGRDVIVGLAGNDQIRGMGGPDLICAGRGNDRVWGAGGRDVILLGPGKDRAWGGAGVDRILGATGQDTMFGGPGEDELLGGRGNDAANGGAGSDVCRAESRLDCGRETPPPPTGPVELAPACASEPNVIDLLDCAGIFVNNTSSHVRFVARVAFVDATGLRLDTSLDIIDNMAPGERALGTFFAPLGTTAVQVLETELDPIEWPLLTGSPVEQRFGGTLLPHDQAVVSTGAPVRNIIDLNEWTIRIRNSGTVTGRMTVRVGFYDATGLRIDTGVGIESSVAPGTEYLDTLFSPLEAVELRVYEVELDS